MHWWTKHAVNPNTVGTLFGQHSTFICPVIPPQPPPPPPPSAAGGYVYKWLVYNIFIPTSLKKIECWLVFMSTWCYTQQARRKQLQIGGGAHINFGGGGGAHIIFFFFFFFFFLGGGGHVCANYWGGGRIHHIYINCWFPVYRWSVM